MNRRAFLVAALLIACKKKEVEGKIPISVRDESEGLLLIWIDEKGDARTETKVKDVPAQGRDVVRVLQPGLEEGTHETVFLVDLRTKLPDGTYALRRAPKSEFENLALARRNARGPTLATAEQEAGVLRPEDNVKQPTAPPRVVIYGASWCKPCHQAADYFQRIGVPYVLKDIEKEPAAASEMAQKLEKANRRGGSIPVLDVGGTILVGYSQEAVDRALVAGGY